MLEQNKFTGDYNVTLYLSLRRDDPLLIASLLSYSVFVLVGFRVIASSKVPIANAVSNTF